MTDQPTEPVVGGPAEGSPPAMPAPPEGGTAAPPPPSGGWQQPAGSPPPPQAPPTYTWQQPAEPAGPAPGVRFAPHGARLVAYIIDAIIVSILVLAVTIVLSLLTAAFAVNDNAGLAGITGLLLVVAIFLISLGYFPYYWAKSGQTPGMRLFRLRVVRDRDGGPISGGQAILRLIGYWVSGAVFYLGYIWIFIDSRRRGWHDLIAGTVVIEA